MRLKYLLLVVVLTIGCLVKSAPAEQIAFLACDSDTYLINQAVAGLQLPVGMRVEVYSKGELTPDSDAGRFRAGVQGRSRDHRQESARNRALSRKSRRGAVGHGNHPQ